MFKVVSLFFFLSFVNAGCYDATSLECLPGIDAVGIGYDAVKGQSFGVGRQVIEYSFQQVAKNTFLDPFGNKTNYAFPDQATVSQRTTQFLGHNVYRSVNDYVSSQCIRANVDAGFGGFFSASVATNTAAQTMKQGLEIVAESQCEIGLYTITLDPSLLLSNQLNSKFSDYLAALPDKYDNDTYSKFIKDYGTHYVSAATLGGLATMSTTISQEYFSQKSDTNIQAQLQVAWGKFGGGGDGGSSSADFDSQWSANAKSTTFTAGGDPAIKSFNSDEEWTKWAKSVQQGSPIITTYSLDFLYELVPEGSKRDNIKKAIFDYAAAHKATFAIADPTTYQMGWCDCYEETTWQHIKCPMHSDWPCARLQCQKPGFLAQEVMLNGIQSKAGVEQYGFVEEAGNALKCCRPCFTAGN